ncbi:hypothetical protein IVB40_07600 [Bradyrhizobium sp. 40]|uniref:hypothetical protein n=1 Tax=Bradyrhizobium sp. 40 TaxID=2782674 RepID=UPI001FFEA037|nr:hypothetical protein [Bradyrhizobium sp. 40]UPJ43925.1 hypothetical protein IVB40_07600 [Bradyrhizobium sp. 40]
MKIKFENWPNWFRTVWGDDQRRMEVIRGYIAFGGQFKATLADIALRNHVFAPINEPNAHLAAIAEGRRQCALEIFKLANVDHLALFELTKIDRTQGGTK